MSGAAVSLKNILTRTETYPVDLEGSGVEELKLAVRFWYDSKTASKARKAECISLLTRLFQDRAQLEAGLRSLAEDERQILAICQRYGGAISGAILRSEVLARGLVEISEERSRDYYRQRTADPVFDLCAKLLLVSRSGGFSRYHYFYTSYGLQYPDLTLLAAVRDLIEPASPLPWRPSKATSAPETSFRRSAAEVALDLWTLAQALAQTRCWKTNRGGAPAKSVQNRLQKLMPRDHQDPLAPPDPEALYYQIRRGVGAIDIDEGRGCIDLAVVERHLRAPAAVQSWHAVRAWMQARLWQDGIGAVPERDSPNEPERIEPASLHRAKEELVWALSRVAHRTGDWLDLETFLIDLGSATAPDASRIYWHNFTWNPDFRLARSKASLGVGPQRMLAYWLDSEGVWAANALMGTLTYLGLIERGHTEPDSKDRPCFRLTPVGQAVFGAPERGMVAAESEAKFLTVQPNHEVLVYLDVADASAVWPLAQMGERTSAPGSRAQTFALTRESVYRALESGLGVDRIEQFLRAHSRTGLPDNVAQSLREWGQKREALVLRSGLTLGACPPGQGNLLPSAAREHRLGDQFVLLPKGTARSGRGCVVIDHHLREPSRSWQVDEEGHLRLVAKNNAVALARLRQFADPVGSDWHITAASVGRARERGIPADQILGWLQSYTGDAIPALMETAIHNWTDGGQVFFGPLLMLQVRQPQACAMIRASPRFQPFLAGHIPPDWFLVRPEKQGELEQLLQELGFSLGGTWKLTEGSAALPGRQARRGRRAGSER